MSAPDQLVEHFFRHESANLTAVLVRIFGFELIDVVEDKVQEALMEALLAWRQRGVPKNPAGWLHQVAKNRIIDTIRRERRKHQFSDGPGPDGILHGGIQSEWMAVATPVPIEPDECQDSLLRMIFACCHPELDRQSQLALTLKVVCGFNDREIGRGLFLSPAAIKKRVTRAKQFLQMRRTSLNYPEPSQMKARLEVVHEVLYLMFNEGHSATQGELPVRVDLCEEAARLCHLLCEKKMGDGKSCALLALMLFHAARFDARTGEEGNVILLADQDRSCWDQDMIQIAEYWLVKSATGKEVSEFHLEAGIARLHCQAPSLEQTDWPAVIRLYDMLLEMYPSPVYNLNKAVALWQCGRLTSAMKIIRQLELAGSLKKYLPFHCTYAKFLEADGNFQAARDRLIVARELAESENDQRMIDSRIEALSHTIDSAGTPPT